MTSQAIPVEGGFRFSGKATYASGSAQASYLMAAALVLRDGAPQFVDGVPTLRAGFFPIKQREDPQHLVNRRNARHRQQRLRLRKRFRSR